MTPEPNTLNIDEATRVNLPLKLLWAILAGVALGAFVAAGVLIQNRATLEETRAIRSTLDGFKSQVDDHEKRLIRIETKTGISGGTNRILVIARD